jgi:LemA protein
VTMGARETLANQRRLSDQEADEILRRASVLQEKERAKSEGRSVADVMEIGAEIDIDQKWIDAALAETDREKANAEVAKAASTKRMKAGLAAIGSALFLTLGLGWAGSISVKGAAADAARARIAFDTVIDRQAALVPQLVAVAGGETGRVVELRAALDAAKTTSERSKAAEALQLELATTLGKLSPASDDATAQQRLSLQHEIVGSQNRISVEKRRYDEAIEAWRSSTEGPFGSLAVALGFANGP